MPRKPTRRGSPKISIEIEIEKSNRKLPKRMRKKPKKTGRSRK